MKDMKLSNIQKESEKVKIKKRINECEDLKAQVLLKLGIMTFDKIRKGEIIDSNFDDLCNDIKSLDIEIYTKYMELRSFEKENKKISCECGYVAFKNEKFCPQCGKSLVKEEKLYITCPYCNEETEKDSKFCSCCGGKIEEIISNKNEVYCDYEEEKEDNTLEEITEFDMIEDEAKAFLKKQEELAIENDDFEENIEINKSTIDEDLIIEDGREFLKNHKDNIQE